MSNNDDAEYYEQLQEREARAMEVPGQEIDALRERIKGLESRDARRQEIIKQQAERIKVLEGQLAEARKVISGYYLDVHSDCTEQGCSDLCRDIKTALEKIGG